MVKVFIRQVMLVMVMTTISFSTHIGVPKAQAAISDTCQKIYNREADNKVNPTDRNVPVGIDQCKMAEGAEAIRNNAVTKAIIYASVGAALIALGALSNVPWLSWLRALCPVIGAVAAGVGMAMDMVVKNKMEQAVQTTAGSISGMLTGYAAGTLGMSAISALKAIIEGGASAVGASASSGCFTSGAFLLLQAGLAIWEASEAKKLRDKNLDAASAALTAADKGRTLYQPPNLGGDVGGAPGSVPGAPSTNQDCSKQSGNAFVACNNQQNPDANISAIIGNDVLNRTISAFSGGKSLGDIAKSYNGDGAASSIGSHVGASLGLPSEFGKTLGGLLETARDLAANAKAAELVGNYTDKNQSESKAEDVDYNKLMQNLLKQISPEEKLTSKEDPTEKVFRKLDLLPASKIESSEISLFARVGYRYRKKSDAFRAATPEAKVKSQVK